MLKILKGDIFNANVEAIINPCNIVGVASKGLSLIFKETFPDNYKKYLKVCKSGELYIGELFIYELKDNKFKYIINFPTKRHWKNNSVIEDINIGLKVLVEKINILNIRSVAIPSLGCGELKFEDVLEVILSNLASIYETNKEVYIYKPY